MTFGWPPNALVLRCARILKAGGLLAIVDNIAPDEGGEFIDAFERLRDPSHVHCLADTEWRVLLDRRDFDLIAHETLPKRMDFAAWVNQQRASPHLMEQLADMLRRAPAPAAWWLRPEIDASGAARALTIVEGVYVGADDSGCGRVVDRGCQRPSRRSERRPVSATLCAHVCGIRA